MKLSVKIAAAFSLILSALLLLQGWMHIDRFARFHQEELEDDLIQLAATLATASERLLERRATPEEVREYLADADTLRRRTQVDSRAILAPEQAVTRRAANGREVRVGMQGSTTVVETLVSPEGDPIWVSVRRSGAEREAFEAELASQQLLRLTLLIAAAVLGSLILGRWLIERPIEEMLEQIGRVGDGDYHVPARRRRNDELGLLQGTLDAMAVRLHDMGERLARRQRERDQLQVKLRHADRLSTVGKLASGLAHELGTPLNVVQGRAKLIARAHRNDAATLKHARIIDEQSERMSALISELLGFSRRSPRRLERVTPKAVVEQSLTLVELMAKDTEVAFDTQLQDGPSYELDVQKLLQVLTNLLQNAMHAMPEGGRIEVAAHEIQVEQPPTPMHPPGGYLEFIVRDEGEGMDEETLAHALDPFFTTKEGGKGTGLGLSICSELVKELGGWMKIDSSPEEGTVVRFFVAKQGSTSPAGDQRDKGDLT